MTIVRWWDAIVQVAIVQWQISAGNFPGAVLLMPVKRCRFSSLVFVVRVKKTKDLAE